jgi:hypothetical protein
LNSETQPKSELSRTGLRGRQMMLVTSLSEARSRNLLQPISHQHTTTKNNLTLSTQLHDFDRNPPPLPPSSTTSQSRCIDNSPPPETLIADRFTPFATQIAPRRRLTIPVSPQQIDNMESAMPTSAATKVFGIPELLETIIDFVPDRFLLAHVQQVARSWKATVETFRMQQQLWMNKGNITAVSPLWLTRREHRYERAKDFSLAVYKKPIAPNSLIRKSYRLYKDCWITSKLTHLLNYGRRYTERDFFLEYIPLGTGADQGPAFLDCSKLSWYPMQICDPPITVAKLHTTSGQVAPWIHRVRNHWNEPLDVEAAHTYTTIYDRDGITMGLIYDTAVATLCPSLGHGWEDPQRGWNFHLQYGIESHAAFGPQNYAAGSDDSHESDDYSKTDDGETTRSQDDSKGETDQGLMFDFEESDGGRDGAKEGSGDDEHVRDATTSEEIIQGLADISI